MRSWRPFCCGWPGWMRSIPIPSLSHQTASLLRLNKACAEAKGTPLSLRITAGRRRSFKKRPNIVKTKGFLGGERALQGNKKTLGLLAAARGERECGLAHNKTPFLLE